MRVWYLAIITHEEHVQIARKPQVRTVIEQASRGTIRDRFNIPLAINKIQYDVTVCYDPIRRLARTQWRKDASGKKTRVFLRQEYVDNLCNMLAKELDLHAKDIEDLLYSKAALFPNTSFTIKENIPEELFYKMKLLERKWPGLDLQISSRRYYPEEEIGAHVIGYMGAISEKEYLSVHQELNELKEFVKSYEEGIPTLLPKGFSNSLEVKQRLDELKARSYTINSRVGKAGIESTYDEDLRGFYGKKKYEVDIQGHFLRELPESYASTAGRRVLLTISSEMQAFAESLLAQNEIYREENFKRAGVFHDSVPAPWIKGGAIVAIIPQTGEVVALASYPRFNPNDFIEKSPSLHKWLESNSYIADIWDGARCLERDFSAAHKPPHILEKQELTWEYFLSTVLSKKSSIRKVLKQIDSVKQIAELQMRLEDLLQIDSLQEAVNKLPELASIPSTEDKILLIDLCRVALHHHLFNPEILPHLDSITLQEYRKASQAASVLKKEIAKHTKQLFHLIDFPKWRELHFKEYLKEKRDAEKKEKRHQKPYLEYLEEREEALFELFFSENSYALLSLYLVPDEKIFIEHPLYPYIEGLKKIKGPLIDQHLSFLKNHLEKIPSSIVIPYLRTMRRFDELTRPLLGRYYLPSKPGRVAIEKDLARHFYPASGFGFARSYAFQETVPQGSIFKIVTALEGLDQHFAKTGDLNPFTIVDECKNLSDTSASAVLGYTSQGTPITRFYKGGRLPRSYKRIGKIGLLDAIEQSSNIYFSLLASEVIKDPLDIGKTAKKFGLGSKTGIDLTGEAAGIIPTDVADNVSGLYSFAIGQHSLTVTPLQTSLFLSALVNGSLLLKPQITRYIANMEPSTNAESRLLSSQYSYKDLLSSIGIYFPFFTEAESKPEAPYLCKTKPEVRNRLYIPEEVKKTLLLGMHRVINGDKGSGRIKSIRTLNEFLPMKKTYQEIQPSMIGKTGTAEILYRPCLDKEYQPILCKHIWCSVASFKPKDSVDELFDEPELIVIVSLRYGDYGKEALPLAAEMVKKWRELQNR